MKEVKTKYPFALFTAIGMRSHTQLDSELVYDEARRVRAAVNYWTKKTGLPWRFRIETETAPVGKIILTRIDDDLSAAQGSSQDYIKTDRDRLGDSHRKYPFDKLLKAGDQIRISTQNPSADRPYAHVAGKAWAKRRGLDWKFKVAVSDNKLYLNIKRIK